MLNQTETDDKNYQPGIEGVQEIIYPCDVDDVPFFIEAVVGCSHNCTYCMARVCASQHGVCPPDKWAYPHTLHPNPLLILERELHRTQEGDLLFFCNTTDPFMIDRTDLVGIHLQLADSVVKHGRKCRFLTKGLLPNSLYQFPKETQVGVTICSASDDFRLKYERNSLPTPARFQQLKDFAAAKFYTWLSIAPFYPQSTYRQDVMNILRRVPFVNEIVFSGLYYFGIPTEDMVREYLDISDVIYDFSTRHSILFRNTEPIKSAVKNRDNSLIS